MRPGTTGRQPVSGPRCLVVIGLLVIVAACVAGSDNGSSDKDGAAISFGAAAARPGNTEGHGVIPSPLSGDGRGLRGPDVTFGRPPVPNLTNRHPEVPPNTVSLEDLHQRGETHVLR
jgi:hypothetical protein